ncbi:hypothetical protein ACFVMC_31820 [Nocardia sp. NPDC127579]|uniref:hypothetical protein n=1 Tax=Nocardia sp. NPDC127579 TaxID=3345402 RepID=UPI0036306691
MLALGLELATDSAERVNDSYESAMTELMAAGLACARAGVAIEEVRSAVRDGIRGCSGRSATSDGLEADLLATVTEAYLAEQSQPTR